MSRVAFSGHLLLELYGMENQASAPGVLTQRFDFCKKTLRKSDLDENPLNQLASWLDEAEKSGNTVPNAMVLCTTGANNMPNGRIMLLRELSHGGLTFFTNYESDKGCQMAENPRASAVFFWPELERQVRVAGSVGKLQETVSDKYFSERPFESKVGAWVSKQSTVVESREKLDERFSMERSAFEGLEVPRPAAWGGYVLRPEMFEFWQGRKSRLHDRLRYRLEDEKWKIERLMP